MTARPLRGQRVLVVGARRAIGSTTCEALCLHGARLAITTTSRQQAEKLARLIPSGQYVITPLACDVRSEESVRQAVEDAALNGLDAIVVNTGAGRLVRNGTDRPLASASGPAIEEVISIGLLGPLRVLRLSLPHLLQNSGTAICISSAVARIGVHGLPAYSAAKAGLEGAIRQIAADYAAHGLHIQGIAMGPVTDASQEYAPGTYGRDRQRRLSGDVTSMDIARAVVSALLHRAPSLNGVTVQVELGATR
jgi:NAD(P)-dependent dehydrogenase (short-subunit alcohol dehydrogenase family)